ncbi:MAG: hypothetical protein GX834_03865, partial [Clostridiaceae bacterium]|nr:hypothetical protein [Clostridiaceae bacterium]
DPAISEITDSEATVSGRVTSDGGAIVSERGFIFSTTANPRINGLGVTKVIAGQGLGDYAVTLTGLMPDTVYTVAAYAINIAGIAYGEDVTFTSLPEPEPKPAPGSDYIFRTLTDSMTGISLSGTIHKDALLTVESINLEDDPACQTIRQYMKDDNYLLLLSKNISLTEDFAGDLTMTIPVDSTYNGKIVTILHCVEGTLKTYTATVTDGKIAFNITSLSPFAVFVKAPSVTPDDPYEPNEHITIPKTGESSPARQGWLLLNISAAALVSLLILKKRRKLTDC